MPISDFVVFIMFVIGFALMPGPNMMLFLTYTFEFGRKAGWATAAGIVSAFVLHMAAIAIGLTALLVANPHALTVLKYTGIAYLLYLAIRNLKTSSWQTSPGLPATQKTSQFYFKGLVSNALNPGSLVLYFSLIPQFIHIGRGNILMQNLQLGALQMLFSFITNCTIIYFAGFANKFFQQPENQRWIRYTMSLLIVLFAVRMVFVHGK